MHTKDKLAAALRAADLNGMATQAEQGFYHDFMSPLAMPATRLIADLTAANTPKALALIERVKLGEFDASIQEAEDWAKSEEGRKRIAEMHKKGGKGT